MGSWRITGAFRRRIGYVAPPTTPESSPLRRGGSRRPARNNRPRGRRRVRRRPARPSARHGGLRASTALRPGLRLPARAHHIWSVTGAGNRRANRIFLQEPGIIQGSNRRSLSGLNRMKTKGYQHREYSRQIAGATVRPPSHEAAEAHLAILWRERSSPVSFGSHA